MLNDSRVEYNLNSKELIAIGSLKSLFSISVFYSGISQFSPWPLIYKDCGNKKLLCRLQWFY